MKLLLDLVVYSVLIWTLVGSLLWIVLDQCGVIENAIEQKRIALGRPVTMFFAAMASLTMILVWPWFVWIAVKRRRQVWIALKRVVWR